MEASPGEALVGRQIDHFVVEQLIGAGGMAFVYRARDLLLGRSVALKALSPTFLTDPDYVERFRREAQQVAALDSQHIAPVLQFIEQDRELYVVMPLYAESLSERLDRDQRLSLGEAIRITSEIGAALATAHAHGLIHRDVKPGNILLDEYGHAILADFGIARQASFKGNPDTVTLAGTGLPVGTPQYMPPEQLRGHDLDHRADIYALGVVLYQMLTGRTPHIGDSPFEVAAAALTQPVLPPSHLDSQIPPAVETVLLRALRANAADRYVNVVSFVEALQAALTAPAPTLPHGANSLQAAAPLRAMTTAFRRPHGWWITATLIALALLVVSGGVIFFIELGSAPGGAGPTFRIGSGVPVPTATPPLDATPSVGATPTLGGGATTPGATPGATPGSTPNATASAPGTATTVPTPTAFPTPTATLPPPPLLTLSPLHLTANQGGQCAGSQTITNSGAQTNTWVWDSVQPSPHFSFLYGVNTQPQFGGVPGDLFPGIAPGGSDVLNIRMKCTGLTYTVTLRDGFGRTQQFAWSSDS